MEDGGSLTAAHSSAITFIVNINKSCILPSACYLLNSTVLYPNINQS